MDTLGSIASVRIAGTAEGDVTPRRRGEQLSLITPGVVINIGKRKEQD